MVKDRFAELSMVRQNRGRGKSTDSDELDPEKQKMLTPESWNEIEQFHDLVERFKSDIEQQEQEVKAIHGLHATLLSNPPDADTTRKMNEKTDDVHIKLRQLAKEIKNLDTIMENKKDEDATVTNRINREQVKRLIRSLANLTQKFNNEQLEYKEKSRKKCMEYLRVIDADLPEDIIEEAIEKGTISEKVRGC